MTPSTGRPPDHQADADAEDRDAVGVVNRAVQRVDDPDPLLGRVDNRLTLWRDGLDLRPIPPPGSRRAETPRGWSR